MLKTAYFIASRYYYSKRKIKREKIFRQLMSFFWVLLFSFSKAKIEKKYQKIVGVLAQKDFIKILSNISMIGIGIGTGALVVVLSVFNGLEGLTRSLFRNYNAELRIEPVMGKTFQFSNDLKNDIRETAGVDVITEVIHDDVLLWYDGKQMVAQAKGVGNNFQEQYPIDSLLIVGDIISRKDPSYFALVGLGIYHQLSINLKNEFNPLQLWYPRTDKKVILNPDQAFFKTSLFATGVLSVDQQFDVSMVIIPIASMRNLLHCENDICSYLEIKTTESVKVDEVQEVLQKILGDDFKVLNADQQQASVLRAVRIERLFVFITFVFVLGIASFNVFFSLAMLAIEKKKDIVIMLSMGARRQTIAMIFVFEGAIIAGRGTFWGLTFGGLVCWLQQEYEIVSFGISSAIVNAYPVEMIFMDFVWIGFVVVTITMLASFIPAINASKTKLNVNL